MPKSSNSFFCLLNIYIITFRHSGHSRSLSFLIPQSCWPCMWPHLRYTIGIRSWCLLFTCDLTTRVEWLNLLLFRRTLFARNVEGKWLVELGDALDGKTRVLKPTGHWGRRRFKYSRFISIYCLVGVIRNESMLRQRSVAPQRSMRVPSLSIFDFLLVSCAILEPKHGASRFSSRLNTAPHTLTSIHSLVGLVSFSL